MITIPKDIILYLASIFVGLGLATITLSDNMNILMIAALCQGIGAGGLDISTNCLVAEQWGDKVQVYYVILIMQVY